MTKKLAQMMPHNLEAEESLLGCIITDGKDDNMIDYIIEKVTAKDFYAEIHSKIYTTIISLYISNKPIDFVTVTDALEKENILNDVGGIGYITTLTNIIASSANYKSYVDIIKEKSKLRNIISKSQLLIEKAYGSDKVSEIITTAEQTLSEITEPEADNSNVSSISDFADIELEKLNKKANGELSEFGIPTGFAELDKSTYGLQKGDMVVIGGRPGEGKTALAVDIIVENTINRTNKVYFASLEMSKAQILKRLWAVTTCIDNFTLKSGIGLKDKMRDVRLATQKIKNSSLTINDKANQSTNDIYRQAKKVQKNSGLDLVVIDYLQFVKPIQQSGNRYQDVGEIARNIKIMARQLNVPVIALCQLNRGIDTADRRPALSDLRESGEIEANADIVLLINTKTKDYKAEVKDVDLILAKNRDGSSKTIPYKYFGDIFTFKEVLPNGTVSNPTRPASSTENKKTVMELEPVDDDDLPF